MEGGEMALAQLEVMILDLQTTGSRAQEDHVIELGYALKNSLGVEVNSELFGIPYELPQRIQKLTGIKGEDLAGKELALTKWEKLPIFSLKDDYPWVIHYAQFEKSFLKELWGGEPREIVCTYRIAKKLWPDLPSHSLRSVSGFLGLPLKQLKRSTDHIQATVFIWEKICEALAQENISDLSELKAFLAEKGVKGGKKQYALPRATRLNLPDAPGVYRLLDGHGGVLYVGKATSLKSRVNSYFRGLKSKGSRLNELVSQIYDIKFDETLSSLEAAVREAYWIKKLDPPYNRAMKPKGKAPVFLTQTFELRDAGLPGDIGPFASRDRVVEGLSLMKEIEDDELLRSFLGVEEDILFQALKIFHERWDFSDQKSCRHSLVGLFAERVRELRMKLYSVEDLEDELDEDEELSIDEESPEQWSYRLEGHLKRLTLEAFVGRWLKRLTNCHLIWQPKGGDRVHRLSMVGGEIKSSNHKSWNQAKAEIKKGIISKNSQNPPFDEATYTKMWVFYLEIRRMLFQSERMALVGLGKKQFDKKKILHFLYPHWSQL